MIDGNGIISQSEDPIESTKGECETRFFRCLCEKLVLDFHARKVQSFRTDESGKTSTAITNLKLCAVLLVRGRRSGIILGMKETGDGRTFRRWNPKI
jgi:hypothetical protein